ncbi:hypothetical protein [Sphingopyxis panaciterrae]
MHHLIDPNDPPLPPDVRIQPTLEAPTLLQGRSALYCFAQLQKPGSWERQKAECILELPSRARTLSRHLRDWAPWNPHNLPRLGGATLGKQMADIDAGLLYHLPRGDIETVVFYKRDEVTSDLICCDVKIAGKTWMFHEALAGWDLLIAHLSGLPGFRSDALAAMMQPAFAACEMIAFRR